MEHANSINGRKILYKKNFFDIQMQGSSGSGSDNEKLNPNMYDHQTISTHFDLNDILYRKKLDPIKLKIPN